ncbi:MULTISPECIES: DUF4189 domain-containing protein [Stenotrophomonas]|uniref:DUF4189 domain-containing protein n=1 Tax=Stenotrophomonas TaxID=40323 RepID=UPI0012FE63C2|nr:MULTISPECIES: DUF4189 domain-containing protein [Stenotrophomonas]
MSKPTGKWETRWGAIAIDSQPLPAGNMAVGVAESEKSKSEAGATSLDLCRSGGGHNCEVFLTYYNQCAALAGSVVSGSGSAGGATYAVAARTIDEAKSKAFEGCQARGGKQCTIIYSACSMSEFKPFR